MKNKLTQEEQRRVKETLYDIIKTYWDGEGSNTYSFCVLLYICIFTMMLASNLLDKNISYGTEEYSMFLGILAISSIIEFVILYLFYIKCKKKGNKEIFIKIMNYFALITTVLVLISKVINI